MLPALLAPLLTSLAEKGLSVLGNAVLAKGKDVIEKQLGVNLEAAVQSEEGLIKLRQLEMEHEEFLINAAQRKSEFELEFEKVAQYNVTKRWQADMLSDSWLSKNIRPIVLVFLLIVYTVFSILSAYDFNITQAYVELLAQMLMLVMAAYFVGRTVEKFKDMTERGRDK